MEIYKTQIQERVKDNINDWITELKNKHAELLLTRQWSLIFPRGFKTGQNVIQVITGSKAGKHLIAEILFILPESLELDMDALELVLKNEPYRENKSTKATKTPVPLEYSLDTLNEMIVGVNAFLTSLNIISTSSPAPLLKPHTLSHSAADFSGKPLNIHTLKNVRQDVPPVDEVKQNMLNSLHLPDWFSTIPSDSVKDELLGSLAKGYIHYQQQGRELSLKDFFELYTDHLRKQDKLYPYCSYKGKAVRLNSDGHCQEPYCSIKPYQAVCPKARYKFGTVPNS